MAAGVAVTQQMCDNWEGTTGECSTGSVQGGASKKKKKQRVRVRVRVKRVA